MLYPMEFVLDLCEIRWTAIDDTILCKRMCSPRCLSEVFAWVNGRNEAIRVVFIGV